MASEDVQDPTPDTAPDESGTPEPEAPPMPEPEGAEVILAVVRPHYQSAITFPDGMRVVRAGTPVPAGQAEDYIKHAASCGVMLSRKEG